MLSQLNDSRYVEDDVSFVTRRTLSCERKWFSSKVVVFLIFDNWSLAFFRRKPPKLVAKLAVYIYAYF